MKAIEFKQVNTIFAKDQPQYFPLPAFVEKSEEGIVTTCYRLTWVERFKLLFTGNIWLKQMTFNQPLQPQNMSVDSPFKNDTIL